MFTLLYSLLLGAFTDRKLSTEDVSAFKEQRNVEALLKEFGDTFPQIKEPLISERDRYLADSIRSAAGPVIVAVVGAGHVPGIKEWLDKPIDKASLDIIHPRSLERRLIGYAIPLSIIGIILYGFGVGGSKTGVSMASAWVWATCITAAIGSIAAFGHPLTILASTLVAPFTAINPFLRPGWVGAIVEAMLRRPRVVDFETVTDDISSLRGIWTNRVSRILLLLVLVNLSSLLGAIYGVKLITALL
jgi:pheromone shutdown-related protein TraB